MEVVVSGASGLIGRALVDALVERGDAVRVLRRGAGARGGGIVWDPESGRIDAPALEGVDAVVHLAGAPIGDHRWTKSQKRRILDSRVRGTAAVAAAVASRARKPAVFVSASAIGYYGDRGEELLSERSVPGHNFLARVCGAWERETAPARQAGVRTVLIRTGIVLAAHGGALGRMLLPFRLGLGGRVGNGRQWMSWIALGDEVGAILHAIDEPDVDGPVNLTAPNPVRNAEFARALGRALHRPAVLPTPLLPLRLRYGSELVSALLLSSQRVAPTVLERTGYEFRHPTIAEALDATVGRARRRAGRG